MSLVVIAFVAALVSPVIAQEADPKEEAPKPEQDQKKGPSPVGVRWEDDFILSTPGNEFWMAIRGNLHFDTKFYGGDSYNPVQFDIRRARMDLRGVLYRFAEFRVQAELADSPYIRNAWVDFKFRNWLHLRGGQMKPPFSTSWWTLDNQVNFLERGAGTPIYPYFDRGWWVWGDLLEQRLTWNLAAFTGAGMELDAPKGDIDDHKDLVGRLFAIPFMKSSRSALRGLHLCVEGTWGRQSIPTKRFELGGYGAAIRDDKFWAWETESVGTGEVGRRDRRGLEAHYINGPFSTSTEYLVVRYEDIRVFAADGTEVLNENGNVTSWSTWASFFLTGETKRVGNFAWRQPKPKEDFDPVHFKGPGSWELLFRYTRTDTSDDLFRTVAYAGDTYRILAGADEVDEYTVGVNWTWNSMIRWQLNYVRLSGDGIRSGDRANAKGTGRLESENLFGFRLIFKF